MADPESFWAQEAQRKTWGDAVERPMAEHGDEAQDIMQSKPEDLFNLAGRAELVAQVSTACTLSCANLWV